MSSDDLVVCWCGWVVRGQDAVAFDKKAEARQLVSSRHAGDSSGGRLGRGVVPEQLQGLLVLWCCR